MNQKKLINDRTAVTTEHILTAPIDGILSAYNITNWDVLIVGDGSGNAHDKPAGWASVLIDRETKGRRAFGGNVNAGSITMAEAMPYIQALSWFDHCFGDKRLQTSTLCTVHIVTDSKVIQTLGNQARNRDVKLSKTAAYLTAYLQVMAQHGYDVHFHWTRRDVFELNTICDLLSKQNRRGGSD